MDASFLSSLLQKSRRFGFSSYLATFIACSTSSSIPSFFAADIGITGIPKAASKPFMSILPPLLCTSSIIFKAITIGILSCISCIVRYKFRSMFVASTIFIIPSGFWLSIKSLVTISSLLYGDSEYIPGKSAIVTSEYSFTIPSVISTVTPGKFPTCWFEPVN